MVTGHGFRDHFSHDPSRYSRFRPDYPTRLFRFLSGLCSGHERAWDCATGNGQAALALVEFFTRVVATDGSEAQIAHAFRHPSIEYRVARAESAPIADRSIDLVTVAQAAHWFDQEAFYAEVRRVVCEGAVLALWGYGLATISPRVDVVVGHFYRDIVGPFWPPERRHLDSGYQSLSFPFAEVETPSFHMSQEWTLDRLLGYLSTWSAVRGYGEEFGVDPLGRVAKDLHDAWGDPESSRTVVWPLFLRVGQIQEETSIRGGRF